VKLVALVSVRDDEPLLRVTAESWFQAVDQVVALDDHSADGSGAFLADRGATVLTHSGQLDFGQRRHHLLEAGRRLGGSHFVALDADEALGGVLIRNLRSIAARLDAGEAAAIPFRTCWRRPDRHRIGGEYDLPLACLFADDGVSAHDAAAIHEDRVPRGLVRVPVAATDGSIVHLQFLAWDRAQMKQAYYRCAELVAGRSAVRINARYIGTLDGWWVRTRPLAPDAFHHLPGLDDLAHLAPSWHRSAVLDWFAELGPSRFEPLNIWHVDELRERFVASEGRVPRSSWAGPVLARSVDRLYGGARARLRRVSSPR
jgi:hypothetical protein